MNKGVQNPKFSTKTLGYEKKLMVKRENVSEQAFKAARSQCNHSTKRVFAIATVEYNIPSNIVTQTEVNLILFTRSQRLMVSLEEWTSI